MEGGISLLAEEVSISNILQHLDVEDRNAFAYACERVRQICEHLFSKMGLSRHIPRREEVAMQETFMDRQLNLNNHRMIYWQMDANFEKFIISLLDKVEALHVLHCGMSLRRLDRILKHAPKLTSLSLSIMDLTSEDIEFLVQDMQSSDGICLENIRNLHLEIICSKPHLQILRYFVLSQCRNLEDLKIYIWHQQYAHGLESSFNNICFPQPSSSITDELLHLHSLTVLSLGASEQCYSATDIIMKPELSEFVFSLVRKKSRATKWKKFWISPQIDVHGLQSIFDLTASSASLPDDCLHELHSVEALKAHAVWNSRAMDDFRSFFERMNDNTLKSLHLCADQDDLKLVQNSLISQFSKSILRTGGHALTFLSILTQDDVFAQTNLDFNILFSACPNITELDLLGCHFEMNICEALCKLKHLVKIQVPHCAVIPKRIIPRDRRRIYIAVLHGVLHRCQNIEEFDIRGCKMHVDEFSSHDYYSDLLAFAQLRKLKSLTIKNIVAKKHYPFLNPILEHCKLLTTLRIDVIMNKSCLSFLESAKSLKHLAIEVSQLDLQSQSFWKHLSCATNLERLCITSDYHGPLNSAAAVEMLKSLPHLHVFHVHFCNIQITQHFCVHMKVFYNVIRSALEEEKSLRICYFELLVSGGFINAQKWWAYNNVLPLNIAELCQKMPSLAIPSF